MTQHPDNRHSDIPRSSCFFIFFCCLSGTFSLFCARSPRVIFFFHTFCTCQVGHLFSSILTSHISNFSSKFWSCRWQTLHWFRVCTKCLVSFLYEKSGFAFVRNVWFRFCTKYLVLVFVRNVVCTNCRAPPNEATINIDSEHAVLNSATSNFSSAQMFDQLLIRTLMQRNLTTL